MTSDDHTQTWEFFSEAAAFDGSAEQVEQWAKRYSRNDIAPAFGVVRDNKEGFLSRFSKDEMVNIVKASTLLEMADNNTFGFGSVHPAILIIWLIRQDFPEECDALDEWVINNSKNEYLPWGFQRGRLKSWSEVKQRDEERARKAAIQEKTDALARIEKRRVKEAKAGVEVIKAQRNIFNAIRRKDLKAIEAMIAKGADLDKPNDEGKTPRAYAMELGDEKVLAVLR
jgi:hypothetical protein